MMPFDDTPAFDTPDSGSGPTAPAGGGTDFFGSLVDLASAVIPGVATARSFVSRVGNVVRGLVGSNIGFTPGPTAFGNQISSRSAIGQDPSDFPGLFTGTSGSNVFTGGWYGATSPDVVTPYIPGGPGSYYSTGPEFTGENAILISPTGGQISMSDLAIPVADSIPRTLRQWLTRIAVAYGPAVASAVWQEFQRRRHSGQSSTLAQAALNEAYPVRGRVMRSGRRRMNPANVRALRRALRRVRAFKRVTRKVRGLGLFGHRGGKTRTVYRRARRGDLSPWLVEDQADMVDEAEDLGYEPEFFRGDEEE